MKIRLILLPLLFARIVTSAAVPSIATLPATYGANYALRFDGVDDRVQAGTNSFPSGVNNFSPNNFTIEFWVNPTAPRAETGEVDTGISGFGLQRFAIFPDHGDLGYGAGHAGAGLSVGSNGVSVFEHAADYLPSVLVYSNAISGWTHVALVYDIHQPRLYVNGALVRTGLTSAKRFVHPSASLAGSIQGIDYGNYEGQLDEVRIWTTPLSQTQIQANMNRSLTGSEPNLVVYFRCDEGTGLALTNHVPRGPQSGPLVNGALSNGPLFVPSLVALEGSLSGTTVLLNGVANPNGTSTRAWFEWGTTTDYGNTTPPQVVGSGNVGIHFSQFLSNLNYGVTYYFRAVASNSLASAVSANRNFTIPIFTAVNTDLPGVAASSVAWGDFDNDGDLDILLTGRTSTNVLSRIYRNQGNGTFTDINAGLPGVALGSAAWGDFDNDGDLDILLTGDISAIPVTRVYRNDGDSTFTAAATDLPDVYGSCAAWGDFDNDGDLDILLTGILSPPDATFISRVYRHDDNGKFTDINADLPGVAFGFAAWGDFDNDGDLDILLTGSTGSLSMARVYRNDGNGTFTDINAALPGVEESSVAWGDFDNDGDLDILLTGFIASGPMARVYRNEGNGTFTDINAGLPGVASSAAWGDFDNDGDLDILLTGYTSSFPMARVYRNDGNGTFTRNSDLLGVAASSVAWGDFDNDGDLDILLTGDAGNIPTTRIYRNNTPQLNTPPGAPTGLTMVVDQTGFANLSWNAATDAQTPRLGLTYNVRVGTAPGASDVMNPMASASGVRRLPRLGNAQAGLTALLRYKIGTPYYWSVQAVDGAFAGSAFGPETSFKVQPVLTPAHAANILIGDLNGDGLVDYHELSTVLSNYFPNSLWLQMTNVAGLGGRNVTFALTNSLAGALSVEYTTNFTNWLFLGPATPRYEFTDTNAPADRQRYYRLRLP